MMRFANFIAEIQFKADILKTMKTTGRVYPKALISVLFGVLMMVMAPKAFAKPTDALIFRGIGKAIVSVLSIPVGVATGAAQGGFPFGMIGGVVKGTANAVGGTLSSAFDLARGGAPYAKYAAFAI